MPMGTIQQQKLKEWLAANAPQFPGTCQLCGTKGWDLGEIVSTEGTSGVMAPMAQLICQRCGQVLLIDARKARLV